MPILKPENSIMAGLAVVGIVYGIYQMNAGPVADVHATEPYNGSLVSSVRKAGWESLVLTAAVALLAKDLNIVILGGATIIAMELTYGHAIVVNPGSGQITMPQVTAYAPASDNVVSGSFSAAG